MRRSQDNETTNPDSREPLLRSSTEAALADQVTQPHAPRPGSGSIFHTSPIIHFLTLSAGISGLLFGYDTGVISSTLVSIGSDLSDRPLTTTDKSLITAITSLLALISAPWTGYFADKYGRRSVIFFPAIFFIAGAVIQAISTEVWVMVCGRAIVGAAVGVASGAVPLYITELAPAEMRGRLVTVQSLFITGGQVVAYLVGWILAGLPNGWRWMVGVAALPAILQLGLLARMPETPRWLVQKGREEAARAVLMKIYTGQDEGDRQETVRSVLANVQSEVTASDKIHSNDDEESSILKELLTIPSNRRALIIAFSSPSHTPDDPPLAGGPPVARPRAGTAPAPAGAGGGGARGRAMYFSATIFSLVGFTSPIGTSLSIATTNFLFTVLAFTKIDTIGRRNILLYSIPFMVLGLGTCSFAFQHIHMGNNEPSSSPTTSTPQTTTWPTICLLLSLLLYVSTYALGLGCVPWQQSELFPLRVRSLGSSFATTTNWSSNFLIGITFLPMLEVFGPSWTFAAYALVCFVGWWAVWAIYPETAGLELEDVGGLFESGWGVSESVRMFRERGRAKMGT
ncbi:Myo-inositol transporter 1 [Lecanosticta acicola]|uniref:Myo-inositol transporter 1 n=1 Tax=Lecanosticta acicola TaxID=111012 RepID=A0AAI8Z9A1_9PEZI|nr:Myo-inositol transporter 1 [Lecanosticta acicola]